MGKKLKKISPLATVEKKISDEKIKSDNKIPKSKKEQIASNDLSTVAVKPLSENELLVRETQQTLNEKATKRLDQAPSLHGVSFGETGTIYNDDIVKSSEPSYQLQDSKQNSNNKPSSQQDYSELFIFERFAQQFALPVHNVIEIIRDFDEINDFPLKLTGCIGSIVYQNKLLPVFECSMLLDNSLTNFDSKEGSFSLVKIEVLGVELCFTMDKYIDVVAGQRIPFSSSLNENHLSNEISFIKALLGYRSSSLFIINLEQIFTVLQGKLGTQELIGRKIDEFDATDGNALNSHKEYMYAKIYDYNFVIEIESILEVVEGCDVTPIYDSNSFVRGLINLRGQVVACLDISSDLDREQIVIDERNKYIVLKYDRYEFALCVHDVIGIKFYDPGTFKPSNSILADDIAKLFLAVSEQNGVTILHLSPESVVKSLSLLKYGKAVEDQE